MSSYIEHLNTFWQQHLRADYARKLRPNDLALYLYILARANEQGVFDTNEPIRIYSATTQITNDMVIDRGTLLKSRDRLKQNNLIDYDKGLRHLASSYYIKEYRVSEQ